MDSVLSIVNKVVDMTQAFTPTEWATVSVLTVVFGYMCLRGMNIR